MNLDVSKSSTSEDRFLRAKDVIKKTGLSKSHLHYLAKTGRFPQSFSLVEGGAGRAWLQSEVEAWMAQRVATRGAA